MTEVERIINNRGKVFTPDFLHPETRSDFFVDTDRKMLWLVSLDLLLEFDRICSKYDLKYWLGYGTLLGAIRHDGFIPWDDDVDVCMPRADYEKIQLLKEEFRHPYFLQTPYTDAHYYYSYIKLRNSNTTSLSKNYNENNNNGISLDIFCVDEWDKSEEGKILYDEISSLIINNSTYMKIGHPNFIDDERVRNYNGDDPLETYDKIQKLCKTYQGQNKEYISTPVITVYGYHRDIFPKKVIEKTIYHKFEGINFPIPSGYDNILRIVYGDYMVYPPVEKRGKWHSAILDAKRPYTSYLEDIKRGVKLWPE